MNALTRLKVRWLDQKSEQGRSLSPNVDQELSRSSSRSSFHSQKLCRRCKQLQLRSHIENPWAIPEAESATGFKIGTIEEGSFHKSCSLCNQLSAVFQHPGLLSSSGRNDRSFNIWCRHIQDKSFKSTYFAIPYADSQEELFLFATKALFVKKDFDVRDGLPRSPSYRKTQTDSGRGRTSFGRRIDSNPPDYAQLKGWVESCKTQHQRTCGALNHSSITPKRLIDCQQRQLCTGVTQPYVCLSYTWGVGAAGPASSGVELPVILPQTVSDAMTVTLSIGLRYLWIDRYCIDQDDAAEKHNVIRHMDAICKFSCYCIPQSGVNFESS